MIKLEAKLDTNDGMFKMEKLEHQESCTAEVFCVICSLIDQVEKFGGIPRKNIYKEIKDFDKKWHKEEKNVIEEKCEKIEEE